VLHSPSPLKRALFIGRNRTPLCWMAPDDRYPHMYRIVWPDGQLSDMTNLARAKDAAIAICSPATPGKDRRRFHWEIEPRGRPCGARQAPLNGRGGP
jgi:hypothetical protein